MQASIYKITPFDISSTGSGGVIKFKWDGGSVTKIQVVIKTNDGLNNIVYQRTISSDSVIYNYEFPIQYSDRDSMDSGVSFNMSNGDTYKAFLRVYYKVNQSTSEWSYYQTTGMLFKCLKEPTLTFASIEQNAIQDSTSWQFELTYTQTDGEKVKSWLMTLYNNDLNIEIASSGIKYCGSDQDYENDETKLRYTFNGFEEDREYKVTAQVETVSGMIVNPEPLIFNVHLTPRGLFSKLVATNYPYDGGIEIKSNLVSIDPYFSKDNVFYFKRPGSGHSSDYVDLRDQALVYKDGFEFPETDWTFALVGTGFIPNERCYSMQTAENNGRPKIDLYYRVKNLTSNHPLSYFELKVYDRAIRNVYFSNMIDLLEYTDFAQVSIICEGGMYWVYVNKMDIDDDSWATTHSELTKYFNPTLSKYTYRNLLTNYLRYTDDYVESLEMNANLNLIQRYGKFITMTQAIADSILHKPDDVTTTFRMNITKRSDEYPYRQTLTVVDDSDPEIVRSRYIRDFYIKNRTWTDWTGGAV